jgi:hypothetical protein
MSPGFSEEPQPETVEARTVKQWMDERGVTLNELIARAMLEERVAQHIVQGQWTPSPVQRQRIASALGVQVHQVRWDHSVPVEHMYGHGPQFGRSP